MSLGDDVCRGSLASVQQVSSICTRRLRWVFEANFGRRFRISARSSDPGEATGGNHLLQAVRALGGLFSVRVLSIAVLLTIIN